MKGETLANLIQCGVTLLLGIIALAGALFCNASFHFFTAMACFWLAWVFYTDNEYGIVSVRLENILRTATKRTDLWQFRWNYTS